MEEEEGPLQPNIEVEDGTSAQTGHDRKQNRNEGERYGEGAENRSCGITFCVHVLFFYVRQYGRTGKPNLMGATGEALGKNAEDHIRINSARSKPTLLTSKKKRRATEPSKTQKFRKKKPE